MIRKDWAFSVGRRFLGFLGAAFSVSWEYLPSGDAVAPVNMRFDDFVSLIGLVGLEHLTRGGIRAQVRNLHSRYVVGFATKR